MSDKYLNLRSLLNSSSNNGAECKASPALLLSSMISTTAALKSPSSNLNTFFEEAKTGEEKLGIVPEALNLISLNEESCQQEQLVKLVKPEISVPRRKPALSDIADRLRSKVTSRITATTPEEECKVATGLDELFGVNTRFENTLSNTFSDNSKNMFSGKLQNLFPDNKLLPAWEDKLSTALREQQLQKLWHECSICKEPIKDIRGHVMIIHFNYKPFVCPMCLVCRVPGMTYRFGRVSDFRRHAKIYHGDEECVRSRRCLQPNEEKDEALEAQIEEAIAKCRILPDSAAAQSISPVNEASSTIVTSSAVSNSVSKAHSNVIGRGGRKRQLTNALSEPGLETRRKQVLRTTESSDCVSPVSNVFPVSPIISKDFLPQGETAQPQPEASVVIGSDGLAQSGSSAAAVALLKQNRHNDASFYTNILCLICNEWVCSRNRYLHIESHLQYRPYRCSVCGYDNRKQIFITLHINKAHVGRGTCAYVPNEDLERCAWNLAENCLEYTRKILLNQDGTEAVKNAQIYLANYGAATGKLSICQSIALTNSVSARDDSKSSNQRSGGDGNAVLPFVDEQLCRPRIHNANRAEKNSLIEKSRKLGLMPDLSLLPVMEAKCQICEHHIVKVPMLNLEEHVRTHLSAASYQCPARRCSVTHYCRSFMCRHMKEVHGYWRGLVDRLRFSEPLLKQFLAKLRQCFPDIYDELTLARLFARFTTAASSAHGHVINNPANQIIDNPKSTHHMSPKPANPILPSTHVWVSVSPVGNYSSAITTEGPSKIDDTFSRDGLLLMESESQERSSPMDAEDAHSGTTEDGFSGTEAGIISDPDSGLSGTDSSTVCFACAISVYLDEEQNRGVRGSRCLACRINEMNTIESFTERLITKHCNVCKTDVTGCSQAAFEAHALRHLGQLPFNCATCDSFPHFDSLCVERHCRVAHPTTGTDVAINWNDIKSMRDNWRQMLQLCFDCTNVIG